MQRWRGCGARFALNSGVRNKTEMLGRKHPPKALEKMRQSAGWNRGLTAKTDERVERRAVGIRRSFEEGREPWSKGHTMRTHPSLIATFESLRWDHEKDPTLRYLEVGYDDPYDDTSWLREQLEETGVILRL